MGSSPVVPTEASKHRDHTSKGRKLTLGSNPSSPTAARQTSWGNGEMVDATILKIVKTTSRSQLSGASKFMGTVLGVQVGFASRPPGFNSRRLHQDIQTLGPYKHSSIG